MEVLRRVNISVVDDVQDLSVDTAAEIEPERGCSFD
jgi:hypothetical protein